MKLPFIDTNIFLRLVVDDRTSQNIEAQALFKTLRDKKIPCYTSHLVIAEMVWVLSGYYEAPKKEIIDILNVIRKMSFLRYMDKFDPIKYAKNFADYNIKFVDCVLASGLDRRVHSVISYDHEFDRLGFVRKEPKDVLKELQ